MVIPDMLKNAPMFKRLDARIKVGYFLSFFVEILFFSTDSEFVCYFCVISVKGKGSALGVGRGRAVAMRARVSISSKRVFLTCTLVCIVYVANSVPFYNIIFYYDKLEFLLFIFIMVIH